MCFDVPKEFGVPDEIRDMTRSLENGRDVKIDILDDYIRTSERFRVIRVFSGVSGSYGNSYWALMGHTGKERKASKGGRTPPHGLVRIGVGRGGAPFLPSPSPCPFFLFHVGGGILLGLGSPSRTPHLGAPYEGRPPPPSILYIRGQGAPHRHTS